MSTLVLDVEGGRLLAVEASASKGRVRVHRAVREDIGVDADVPDDLGGWLRSVLDTHAFKATQAVVAVARGEVLIKRLDPPAEGLSAAERHEMIHLQMTRQASLAASESVIDYIEIESAASRAAPASPDVGNAGGAEAGAGVVAAAMPTEKVDKRRQMIAAACGRC